VVRGYHVVSLCLEIFPTSIQILLDLGDGVVGHLGFLRRFAGAVVLMVVLA
jgi:hypothetical protein